MTLIEKVFTLKSIQPFDTLYDGELILTADVIKVKYFKAGDTIYRVDSLLSNLYIIAKGEIAYEDGESIKGYFGLETLVHDKPIKSNIIASSDVTFLLLSQEHLLTLLYESPHLMIGFLKSQKEENNEVKI